VSKTTVSSKGQIGLPAEIREQDDIQPGQEFTIERLDRGEYRLRRRTPPPNEGVVFLLLSCPEIDFLVPIESRVTRSL
jgi:AbrB family looped-hinge helix DNA binding protein